jgi:aminopeptidase
MDSRVQALARTLVRYSCNLRPGEKVLIDVTGFEPGMARALVVEAYEAGGLPFVNFTHESVLRSLLMHATLEQVRMMARFDAARMKEMDAYIGLRAGENVNELVDVPAQNMKLYQAEYLKPVHSDLRVPHTKWVVLRWPNQSMAQLATMSAESFADFFFTVCTLDYARMGMAMEPLHRLMEQTDQVRIVGPGETDLTFSIRGIQAVPCAGRRNIPDGECFTAPVRESVNGVLAYNVPSVYQGFTFSDVKLEFENGRIVRARANDTERINRILDADEGGRYIGEFSLGFNPYILHPMKDTLFDEKIAGSFHFTPGQAYTTADNGNRSAIHWDLVVIQRPDYGGGEIWFDGQLVRKDGLFVLPELEGLNPDHLK